MDCFVVQPGASLEVGPVVHVVLGQRLGQPHLVRGVERIEPGRLLQQVVCVDQMLIDGVSPDHVSMMEKPSYENLVNLAATYSDGLIQGSANLPDPISEVLKKTGKPCLDYVSGEEYVEKFSVFYDSLIND